MEQNVETITLLLNQKEIAYEYDPKENILLFIMKNKYGDIFNILQFSETSIQFNAILSHKIEHIYDQTLTRLLPSENKDVKSGEFYMDSSTNCLAFGSYNIELNANKKQISTFIDYIVDEVFPHFSHIYDLIMEKEAEESSILF